MKKEKEYYLGLDIIRILSCALVLLYHLNIVKGGFLAVCTFFAMTGYLGCVSALKQEKFSIGKYYLNRIKKIYLPLIVVVALTIICVKFTPSINWINLKPETTSVIFGYNNFWQLSANLDYFTRHVNSPFMHLWYIAILMQFELVFPIVFWIFKKIKEKIKVDIGTIVVFLLTIGSTVLFFWMSKTQDIMLVYYNTFARSFSILFGVLLALIHTNYNIKLARAFKKIGGLIFILYAIVLVVLSVVISAENTHYALFMLIATIISTRLIEYSTLNSSNKEDTRKFVDVLSRTSYEIYLVQYPVIFLAQLLNVGDVLKNIIIIIATLVIAYILNLILSISSKKHSVFLNWVKYILLGGVIIAGGVLFILAKDNTAEMKELEEKLNGNLKDIEARNADYLKKLNEEQDAWNELLGNMEMQEEEIANIVTNLPIVGVGDSVMLGTADELYATFPNGYFDGKVSRSIVGGRDVLSNLISEGKLGNTVVLALANNGDYSNYQNDLLMELLGDREIFWIDAVNADDPKFNVQFEEYAKDYDNLHIVHWEQASLGHDDYFYADGVHLKGDGPAAYAKTLYDAIYNVYLEEYNKKKNELIQNHENELKTKIAFYGNDVLTTSFSFINDKFENAIFNVKSSYSFDDLYSELEEKIANNSLQYRLVFLFDKKANISSGDYKKIAELCKDYKIYICNTTSNNISVNLDNVTILDFYDDIKNNENYLMVDRVHLSDVGNEALAQMLFENIE